MTEPSLHPGLEPSPAAPRSDLPSAPTPPADSAPRGLAPALLVVVLAAVALIVGPTIAQLGDPGPDEFYYLSYSRTLAEHGPGAIRDLFRIHVAEPRHWQFPSPLRVGYLEVAALWTKLDSASPQGLAHLSLLAHLLSIVVVYRLVVKELGSARALFTASLFAFSPLLLGMSRRALQDSFATLTALVALSTFLTAIDRPENRKRLVLFAIALAFAILSKESLALLTVPMALWLAIEWRRGKARASLIRVGAAIAAALALSALAWIAAAGSFDTVRQLAGIVLRSPATNAYAIRYGGGPWYRYLVDLVTLSPGPTLLGLGGLALVLERTRRGEDGEKTERLPLFLALVAVATLAEFAFLTKNVRYVMLLELPFRLLAVEALWRLVPVRAGAARAGAVAALVALLAAADVRSFDQLFLAGGLYDPMSAPLLTLRGFVPGP